MSAFKEKFEDKKNSKSQSAGAIIDAASSHKSRLSRAADAGPNDTSIGLEFLADVNLKISVVLAETKMPMRELLALGNESVVQLNKLSGEPVDLYLEDQKLGKGEVIVLQEKLRIRLLEVTPPSLDLKSLLKTEE